MTELRVAHTSQLDPAELAAARALLYDVFDDMSEDDWEHALGGMHALVSDGDTVIGHGSVIQRRLLHGGRALRTGYVEAVAVRPDRQRQGIGSLLMRALEDVIARAYDLGALGATDEGAAFYRSRGWRPWRGPTSVITPTGLVPTPDEDGSIYILPGPVPLDLTGHLTCDWRNGDAW
ncbi:aminoglycoside 2'-N-acetyltransferase [Rhizocola hellebori]|uniref:Aminoglycoside 2'-N-acetyltransferase n=1 Tax=Rhizocola hellebori TaxID=1392758 RepID=A0A8J3QA51_9ACTN|nr:GNAT family N-acetyltransferase [Rhizocola hellebori]GIH06944.1 aminoglycoside 2'-N-acetyltransferase [Rhizocola hellebori]